MIILFSKAFAKKATLLFLFSLSIFTLQAQVCDNITDGGTIIGEESGCNNPTFDPSPITSTAPATGGSGDIQYIWMQTTGDPNAPFNTWQIIPGANGESYDPGPITQTTYYGRCARRSGCTEYSGETNFIAKTISCCNINASISASQSTICSQESLQLLATADGDGLSFVWEASGGTFSDPNIANPVYTMMMEGTYTIKVSVNNGECTEMTTTTITVDNTMPVSISTDITSIDINQILQLNSVVSGDNITYSWSSNGGTFNSTTISNPTFTATSAGTYQIILTATNENGCSGTDTINITVNESLCNLLVTGFVENASCAGNDGAIQLTVSDANGAISYQWSPSGLGNTGSLTNLIPGDYTVTVTDEEQCEAARTLTVGSDSGINISPTIQQPSCSGVNDGSITISVTGGSPGYTYNWSNNLPNAATVSNLAAGTYFLTVIDSEGCRNIANYQITNTSTISLTTSSSSTSCEEANGTATVTASGGIAPYTYRWNDSANQTTATATNLLSGTYQVTITDSNNCEASTTVVINNSTENNIMLSTQVTDANCNRQDGAINLTISGGVAPYTISWDNNIGNVEDPTGISAGLYTVEVTDATGCKKTLPVIVREIGGISASISMTNISCNGGSDGSATVTVNGGSGNYNYSWSNGSNTATINNLAAGNYTVTATDTDGCSSIASITLIAPEVLLANVSPTDSDCNNPNGSAIVNVSGGTAGFTYRWSDANNQTTQTAVNLPPGDYNVTVTDANNCTAVGTTTISANAGLVVTLSTTDVLCHGENSGTIAVNIANGEAPYSYQWNNSLPDQSSFVGLAQGIYEVTVTDANGCFGTASAKVHGAEDIIVNEVVENTDCDINNGRARLDVSGGSSPYTYNWGPPLNINTSTINNLSPGTYNYTVTDANGCMKSGNISIIRPEDCNNPCEVMAGIISTASPDTICAGDGQDDIITVQLSGNQGPNNSWVITDESLNILELPSDNSFNFDGAGFGVCLIWNVAYDETISGLVIGQNLADLAGCQELSNSIRVVRQDCNMVSCEDFTGSVSINNPAGSDICAKAIVSLSTTPSETGFTYSWSASGGNFDNTTSATPDYTMMMPGTYQIYVTVTKDNCTTRDTTTVTIIEGPSVSLSSTDIDCDGDTDGSITSTVTGGTAPYTYTWSDATIGNQANPNNLAAGTYNLTVTDANGCTTTASSTINSGRAISINLRTTNPACGNADDGSITAIVSGGQAPYTYNWSNVNTNSGTINNLGAGTYNLTVTDANGCSQTASATLTNEATDININLTPSNPSCDNANNGSINASVSGGQAPYAYAWSNNVNTATNNNLGAGTYNVTVTDANGCSNTASVTLTNEASIMISLTTTNPSCGSANNGGITATVSGGQAPYSYSWGDNATLNNLEAGTYSLTVTDANGCSNTASATLTDEGSAISINLSTSNPSCGNSAEGNITASVSGGSAPYTYVWSNNGGNSNSINDLTPGNYSVTVTDANGCSNSANATISAGAIINVTLTTSGTGCDGNSINAMVNGGAAPYTYNWSNGENTNTITDLAPGNYSVTVTDANGCSGVRSATIGNSTDFDVSIISSTREICAGESVNFGANPNNNNYTYQWSASGGSFDDATSATAIYTMMMPGTYEIILTASNGTCSTSDTTEVTVSANPSGSIVVTDVVCAGENNGSINLTASSDNGTISYQWDNNLGNIEDPTGLSAGTYNVTITDAAGCTTEIGATVEESSNLTVELTRTNVDCGGANNGAITASSSGGVAPISYAWSNGAGNVASISNLGAGQYSVTVTDALGCTKTESISISEPTPITAVITNSAEGETICPGTGVNLTASPNNANLTYSWIASGGTFDDASSATPVYTMMMTGTHQIILVVSDGTCTASDTTQVTIGQGIDYTIASTDISCGGETDGSITITINNAASPVSYNWDNGIGNIANPTGLSAGTYNVTITDANNCTRTESIEIQSASTINLSLTATNIRCNGDNNGSISATVTGGTGNLSYSWSNGTTGVSSINNLSPGTYRLTVTDSNGCDEIEAVEISEPALLTATTEGANVGCNSTGHAHVHVEGGTAPYMYLWNDAANQVTDTAFNLVAGDYMVTVTDANNCVVVESVSIIETDAITCSVNVINYISSINGSDGSLGVEVMGGSGNYTYNWSNGGNSSVINGLDKNTYSVTITDETGCECSDTFTLLNPAVLGNFVFEDADSNGIQDVSELGVAGITLQLTGTTYYGTEIVLNTVTNSNGNYEFVVPPGDYKVTVVNAFGYEFTSQDQGTDDTIDSDFNADNNMSQIVTLAENEVNLTVDLGVLIGEGCQNILTGGAVEADESICGPEGDPSIITNVAFPSGGVGVIEYLWLKSDITSEYYPGHPDWMEIPNSNSPDYDPGVITKTTHYIRCARRKGCNSYPGESNIITKTILECATNPVVENLKANVLNGQVELTWDGKLPVEDGNYIIERSLNGTNFQVVNTMKSTISESMTTLHFMDKTPNMGENYYRIKTFAPTISSSYSNIASAMIKPSERQKVMVYPNPVQTEFTVHFFETMSEMAVVQIVSGYGQVIRTLELDSQTSSHQIDISDLPSGLYFVKFGNKSLKLFGHKFYKVEE